MYELLPQIQITKIYFNIFHNIVPKISRFVFLIGDSPFLLHVVINLTVTLKIYINKNYAYLKNPSH